MPAVAPTNVAELIGPPVRDAPAPAAPGVDVNDPKRRILLAGLLVGSFFVIAKLRRFL